MNRPVTGSTPAGRSAPRSPSADISLTCPHCHRSFPLTDALSDQAREILLGSREAELRAELGGKYASELEALKQQLAERDQKTQELRDEAVNLRRERRELEDRRKDQDLHLERARDELEKECKAKAEKQASQAYKARLREKEDQIRRTNQRLSELERQTQQEHSREVGIQQQILFGEQLRQQYPTDEITIVRRGQVGPDVHQVVRTLNGRVCGMILWECKSTAHWDNKWIPKLKGDREKARADIGVIVSRTLPENTERVIQREEIWICDFATVWYVAPVVRNLLLKLALYRSSEAACETLADQVYDYVATGSFFNRLAALVRSLDRMQADLNGERRAVQQRWAARQKQIDVSLEGLASLVGDLDGLGVELPGGQRCNYHQCRRSQMLDGSAVGGARICPTVQLCARVIVRWTRQFGSASFAGQGLRASILLRSHLGSEMGR